MAVIYVDPAAGSLLGRRGYAMYDIHMIHICLDDAVDIWKKA